MIKHSACNVVFQKYEISTKLTRTCYVYNSIFFLIELHLARIKVKYAVCPGSSDPPEKKYLIYLHQKMRLTPFINYYDNID